MGNQNSQNQITDSPINHNLYSYSNKQLHNRNSSSDSRKKIFDGTDVNLKSTRVTDNAFSTNTTHFRVSNGSPKDVSKNSNVIDNPLLKTVGQSSKKNITVNNIDTN